MKHLLNEYFTGGILPKGIASGKVRRIMILGGTDTGKTTLAECLADLLSQSGSVGFLDLDIGQSTVGPPTTTAWTRIARGFPGRGRLEAMEMAFVGSLSPKGNLLAALAGAVRMIHSAAASCSTILIDTSGFIEGPDGRIFKQFKIDLLEPDLVIALQRGSELEPVLQGMSHQRCPDILRLPAPPGVRVRSPEARAAWRLARFADYFTTAAEREIPIVGVGLRATRDLPDLSNFSLINRIVSLRDGEGNDLALGVLREVRRREGIFLIRTPLESNVRIATIMLGEAFSPL
jgi:polynucleotide 5'-hydroxyl-kinase GRC3/NOL9